MDSERLVPPRITTSSLPLLQAAGCLVGCALGLGLSLRSAAAADETSDHWRQVARQALADGRLDEALDASGRAVELAGDDPSPLWLRARIHEARGEPAEAFVDCNALLKSDRLAELPRSDVYDLRGRARFRLADAIGSADDFDRAIEVDPKRAAGHWQRGISCYYAERYDDGRKQFERYQTVDNADVENAVWRYLCMAPMVGADEARRQLLKIGDDRRVPMREIYELFAGRATIDEVLAAAEAGEIDAPDRRARRFYAHLYVGLYLEAAGQRDEGLKYIGRSAEEFAIGHYMADVARTHVKIRNRRPDPR